MGYFLEAKYVKRDPDARYHCRVGDLRNLDLSDDRVTVLCLSGNGATDPKEVNGYCKQIEGYLKLLFNEKEGQIVTDNVDIVGIQYGQRRERDLMGSLSPEDMNIIANEVLMPHLINKNGGIYPIDEACRRMSKVVFSTYCAGVDFLNDIMELFSYSLVYRGYTPREAAKIITSCTNVCFAPFDDMRNYVPSVRIISAKDGTSVSDHLEYMFSNMEIEELDGIYFRQDRSGSLYGKSRNKAWGGNITVITSQLVNGVLNYINEHNISVTGRTMDDWDIVSAFGDSKSKNADCISQIMAWALCRAVENGMLNLKSTKYIPNNFSNGLLEELVSIRDAFTSQELAVNPELKFRKRKSRFDELRSEEILRRVDDAKFVIPGKRGLIKEVKAIDMSDSNRGFVDIYNLCEKYNFYHLEDILKHARGLTDTQIGFLKAYRDGYHEMIEEERIKHTPRSQVWAELRKATSLEEIKTIIYKHGDKDMVELVADFIQLVPESKKGYNLKIEEFGRIWIQYQKDLQAKVEFMSLSPYQQMASLLMEAKSFEDVVKVFGKYGFLYYEELKDNIANTKLTTDESLLIKLADILSRKAKTAKRNRIHLDQYEEMIDTINESNSFNDVLEYLKNQGYVGASLLMQEDLILTDEERAIILKKAERHNKNRHIDTM